jgi:hypothetical protein
LVKNDNWCAIKDGRTFYAKTSTGGTTLFLHNVIFGPCDKLVDHIDGDGLNNRRSNLRAATTRQNQANKRLPENNTSGFKGVREAKWATGPKRWRATIFVDGKHNHLGYFFSPEEAAVAYDYAAERVWGEFANPNMRRA